MYNWHYLFSFWIYICFLLYINKFIPFNPMPVFLIIFVTDIYLLYNLFSIKIKTNTMLLRLFFILSIHYFPLYNLLKYDKFNFDLKSIIFYSILFLIYLLYIHVNNLKIDQLYSNKINKESIKNFIKYIFDNNYQFYGWIIYLIYMNIRLL